ncbi:MAG: XdhC family protein [Pseudomonadota bacterium]
MGGLDFFDIVQALREEGAPFCIATVVRTADATSAKAGAKAVVTETGEIRGHLGGACVKRALARAVGPALIEDRPRVIRIQPDAGEGRFDEIELFRSGCPSGGTVDILIEPFRPPSLLAILGSTPIAEAIGRHAELMGFRVAKAAPDEGLACQPGPRDAVILACQGQGDMAALRLALATRAGHISMIASRRKAASLNARLAGEGVPARDLARVKSPAGLDVGAIDPHEIAISVLAEIVRWRRQDSLAEDQPRSAQH